eukprot:gb/GECG01001884.1/.p1 GENE.gb/GECG01001884.1/~~gb/GECG01001884.1/.p1  ORF type:complete len:521 (+),score=61.19 gb/GECG01001884.1/:1-1563(+)
MTTTISKNQDVYDVIVVGAGFAGLTAANILAQRGRGNILVLEAADYIGGRCRQMDGILEGTPVDIGAEFIHGPDTEAACLAKALGVPLRALFTWSQGDGGPSEKAAEDGGVGYYYIREDRQLKRFDEVDEDIRNMHQILHGIGEDTEIERTLSMKDYLLKKGVTERASQLAEAGVGNTSGRSLAQLSANLYSTFERCWSNDAQSSETDYRPERSFRPLIETLGKRLNIKLKTPVRRIDTTQETNTCVVSTDESTFAAMQVIVTVPLPVLQEGDIEFDPPLSAERREALNSMQFSNAVKIHLVFNKRCWPKDCHGAVCSGCFVPELWITNNCKGIGGIGFLMDPLSKGPPPLRSLDFLGGDITKSNGNRPEEETVEQYLVTGFLMGMAAEELVDIPHQNIVLRFLNQLEEMFHTDVKTSFVKGWVHNWRDNKYIRGGYTSPSLSEEIYNGRYTTQYSTGSLARKIVASPHQGLVFFAGEAIAGAEEPDDAPMTIHGAMRTGMKAALQAMSSAGQSKEAVAA